LKKDELITFVSENADITKKSAGGAINAVIEGITSALEKGILFL
jgi:nucleoid DNA-binding protein